MLGTKPARHWRLALQAQATRGFSWLSAGLLLVLFGWLIVSLLISGLPELSWAYLSGTPSDGGRSGGVASVLVSTLILVSICMATSLPLGLLAAVYLAEFSRADSALGRSLRLALDLLATMPSIVLGLFGMAFFCIALGMGFSLLAGGLTLACMVLPILVRSIEQSLRALPQDYRLASLALGLSRARMVIAVLLPAAWPGVQVGMVLGLGRALAETAALLFTSGYVDRMPESLLDSGRSLSVHIYDLAMNISGGEARASAAALLLVVLLLLIHGAAQWLSQRIAAPLPQH